MGNWVERTVENMPKLSRNTAHYTKSIAQALWLYGKVEYACVDAKTASSRIRSAAKKLGLKVRTYNTGLYSAIGEVIQPRV